ncbi:L,D-transpeptidase family protein [Chitinophaga horti]|uniref:L,D-transpeptidase family protein n=1 Tax=Chitinophaga horti TaxID=2920382 RepID=A0ABY6J0S2_9BACT|nr:L,D-transpeptidase family protein [Chitinophaga horti]UYQ93016.1 L,D-transpeptidase family protein [Chitinophaga horti]
MITRSVLLLMFAAMATVSCQRNAPKKQPVVRDTTHYTQEEYISLTLDSNLLNSYLARDTQYAEYIRDFYRRRDFHFAWINESGVTEQAGSFINMMGTDASYGIAAADSVLQATFDTLSARGDRLRPSDTTIPRAELQMTARFFHYASKTWGGLTSDKARDLEWYIPRKKIDMGSLLDSVVATKSGNMAGKEPVNRQYNLLRERLAKLSAQEGKGWDSIKADKKTYKKGDSARVVSDVKARLLVLGDLQQQDASPLFDVALDSAIRTFQARHGLTVNGQLNQSTLNALNVSPARRIRQILVNMERIRWVPVDPGGNYILVNIPEFRMHIYENDKLAWSSNVVVGTPANSTVIFSREMKYVVFAPYWNVPPGILGSEVLPGIKRSTGYLARHNMEVAGASGNVISPGSINWSKYTARNFPYIIRQKPGGANSLGKVKFLFPNEYNIYLHDTPSKGLFNETKRSFSHGCIRVSEPKRLAMYLLRNDSAWTEKRIDAAMNATKEQYVTLKYKLPVFIGYFTAWVGSDGQLNFRDDVYGHDAKLAVMLFGKS